MLALATAFATGTVLARLAFDDGVSIFTLNLCRTGGAALTTAMFLVRRRRIPTLPAAIGGMAAGLGLLITVYTFCLFRAVQIMPVPLAIVAFYTWPLMVGVGSWLAGTERLSWQWPVAALGALVGLVLALDAVDAVPNLLGTSLALVAAALWSVVMMVNRTLVRGGDSQPVTLWMMGASCALNIAGCLIDGFAWPHSTVGWVGLIGTALLYCFASVGVFIASSINGPVRTALILNFEPIANLMVSAVVLGEVLRPLQILGAAIVVGSLIAARRASTPVAQA